MWRPLITAVVLALAPRAALAQTTTTPGTPPGFDAHGFALAPNDGDLKDFTSTWRAEAYQPYALGLEGLFEYAYQPLVLVEKTGVDSSGKPIETRFPLVNNLVALNLGAFFAVHKHVAIGVSAPLYLWTQTDQGRGPVFGDVRFSVPIYLATLGDPKKGTALSFTVIPFGVAPTGQPSRYLGDPAFGGGGLLAMSLDSGPLDLSLNVGARTHKNVSVTNANGGSALDYYQNLTGGPNLEAALAVAYELTDRIALRGEVHFEPYFKAAPPAVRVPFSKVPGQATVSARGYATDHLSWTVGLGTALTRGIGAAPLRVFAGLNGVVGKTHSMDKDGDGIPDAQDKCPDQPETMNGYKDDDGCPDSLATVKFEVVDPAGNPIPGVEVDLDGKNIGTTTSTGVVTASQLMPGTTKPYATKEVTGYQPASGNITLAEGEQTQKVTVNWVPVQVRAMAVDPTGAAVPATVAFADGPVPHANVALGDDGTEVVPLPPGNWTLTFTAPGYDKADLGVQLKPGTAQQDAKVTMHPSTVTVTPEEVEITQTIHFDFDKATIRPESSKLLDEIALVLKQNPQVKLVQVNGYTSSEGTAAYNLDLSQRRVDAVVDALVKRGVDRKRMVAKGHGEADPVYANDTEAHRALNRRVQFVILKQDNGK